MTSLPATDGVICPESAGGPGSTPLLVLHLPAPPAGGGGATDAADPATCPPRGRPARGGGVRRRSTAVQGRARGAREPSAARWSEEGGAALLGTGCRSGGGGPAQRRAGNRA